MNIYNEWDIMKIISRVGYNEFNYILFIVCVKNSIIERMKFNFTK